MPPLRVSAVIDAPHAAVVRALRRADLWTRAARAAGGRGALVTGGLDPTRAGGRTELRDGDQLALLRTAGRRRVRLVVHLDDAGLPRLIGTSAEILPHAAATAAGTLVTLQITMVPTPAIATVLLRARTLAFGQLVLGIATIMAREPLVVMAGAVVEGNTVLAARRGGAGELAGRWELPGGKVEDGETEQQALARELQEELGIDVRVGQRLGADVPLGDGLVLRTRIAAIVAGEPRPSEHDELRWLTAGELDGLDWLPADRAVLPDLARFLAVRV